MQLAMLAQQMPAAQKRRIDVPDPHLALARYGGLT
jgi:hypothetical protein